MSSKDQIRNQMTKKRSSDHGVRETIVTIFWAVVIALVVRTFAFEPFNIPSGSMIPTLLVGDYLFVSKYSYGYSRYSFFSGFPPFSGRVLFSEPERGDVVVFKLPADNKTDYIKRVIGLPGDLIQVREGLVHINGDPVERERKSDHAYVERRGSVEIVHDSKLFLETLPNGRMHPVLEVSDQEPYDSTRAFRVPDDHYLMLGDNRDRSRDSRAPSVGFVPKENLVGRAEFIFFSTNGEARWWQVWNWPSAIRWGRLFQGID